MVRSGRGPSPFPAWRSLLPGANHRILPEAAPARRGGRRIGSAIALLPLLACCGLLPPASTLARRSRWALGVLALLAGAALLPSAPAEAQTVVDLVSNTSKPKDGVIGGRVAQSFRTGANVLGYTLSGIRFSVSTFGSVTFKIREDVGGNPGGSELATLSGNVNTYDLYTLTAPAGVTLNPNTRMCLEVGGNYQRLILRAV